MHLSSICSVYLKCLCVIRMYGFVVGWLWTPTRVFACMEDVTADGTFGAGGNAQKNVSNRHAMCRPFGFWRIFRRHTHTHTTLMHARTHSHRVCTYTTHQPYRALDATRTRSNSTHRRQSQCDRGSAAAVFCCCLPSTVQPYNGWR